MADLQSLLGGAKTSYTMGAPLGGLMSGFASNEAEKANALEEIIRRENLRKQQQENDRYGQITPFEVAQERQKGNLADLMNRPENLQTVVAGKMGEANENSVKGALALATKDSQIASALSKNKLDAQKNTYINAARALEIPMTMIQYGTTDFDTIVNSLPESERGPFTQLMKGAMASGKFKSPIQAIPLMHKKFGEMVSNIQQQSEAAQAAVAAQRADWEFGGKQREAGVNTRQAQEIEARKTAADLAEKRAGESASKTKTLEALQVEQFRIMSNPDSTPEQKAEAEKQYKFLEQSRIAQRVAVAKLEAEAEAEWNRRYGAGESEPAPASSQTRKVFNPSTGKWEEKNGAL